MATIPAAVCALCKRTMICKQDGVMLQMQNRPGDKGVPHYLVYADLYECPNCGRRIYTQFADRATMAYDADFQHQQKIHPDRIQVT